jgi:hypothetical protein
MPGRSLNIGPPESVPEPPSLLLPERVSSRRDFASTALRSLSMAASPTLMSYFGAVQGTLCALATVVLPDSDSLVQSG